VKGPGLSRSSKVQGTATVMKRPSSTSSAPSKKQKKSPRVSQSEIVVPDEELGDAQWEKVEKRKAKKARKTDVKLDVCVSIPPARVLEQSHTPQANPPRFLYSNSEIIKRRDPVGINVLSPLRSFIYRTHYCKQDVRDFVLHIVADAPPPSWIRVQVSLPHLYAYCYLHTLRFPEPSICTEASCPPCSGAHIDSPRPHLPHQRNRKRLLVSQKQS